MIDFTTYTFPDWATSDAAQVFLMGFITGAMLQIFRAALGWFKAASDTPHE